MWNWLCRVGVHRWTFKSITDDDGRELTVTTFAWCRRDGCGHSRPMTVDVETRRYA
jgi:hypothetical protein